MEGTDADGTYGCPYDSFQSATDACNIDHNCQVVQDLYCDGSDYKLCKRFGKGPDSSTCIYRKRK